MYNDNQTNTEMSKELSKRISRAGAMTPLDSEGDTVLSTKTYDQRPEVVIGGGKIF